MLKGMLVKTYLEIEAVGAVSLCVHCRFSPEQHDYSSYVIGNIYNNITVLNCNNNSLLLSKSCK